MNPRILRLLPEQLAESGKIPIIAGPTASGKTELAIALAEALRGEIISADSMQFYRGVDIGSAKPTPDELRRVPHHLIDTMDISEKSDIYRFRDNALRIIEEIRSRGNRPVIAGGSGLYIHALVYGLDDLPFDHALRKELDERYDNPEHFGELADLMQKECPQDFEKFGGHRRKLIRAREVFLLSGHQITELQHGYGDPDPRFAQFIITRDRDDLKRRIRKRTAKMLDHGWIEEAKRLLAQGILNAPTAWQAIGYAQIKDYLDGIISRTELEEQIATATWQYARRQMTWFRNRHPQAIPLVIPPDEEK